MSEQLHEVTDSIGQLFAGLEDSAELVSHQLPSSHACLHHDKTRVCDAS